MDDDTLKELYFELCSKSFEKMPVIKKENSKIEGKNILCPLAKSGKNSKKEKSHNDSICKKLGSTKNHHGE